MQKPEVLAPAGDRERLETAIFYGADAVYLGGKMFGMRQSPGNFDNDGLKSALEYCRSKGVKMYVTCNIIPRNNEIDEFIEYLKYINSIGVDAAIVTDIGILRTIKKKFPELAVHISTQMGVTNWLSAKELHEMGASRVVLARELSVNDIARIRDKTPPELEIEAFVHGAMCVSFSGRCLISNYLVGRDANRGECAQPCRWKWNLVEERRPGQYFPIVEEDGGTYFFNAQDMCLLNHLDTLYKAGITSFKIEGRAKAAYYVAVVTNAYRCAVDILAKNPDNYELPQWLVNEPTKVSHREYCTGFYFPENIAKQYYGNEGYKREWQVVAIVEGYSDGELIVSERNVFCTGDCVEVLEPGKEPYSFEIGLITGADGQITDRACHPMEKLKIRCDKEFSKGAYIRKLG